MQLSQECTNLTVAVHERVDSRFLILPGSESTITEITEYIYFGPSKPVREFKYKSECNTVPVNLIIQPILFLCCTSYLHFTTRVFGHSAITFLGGHRITWSAKEPCIFQKKLCILSKETYMISKEPKHPRKRALYANPFWEDIGLFWEDIGLFWEEKRPTWFQKSPNIPAKEPCMQTPGSKELRKSRVSSGKSPIFFQKSPASSQKSRVSLQKSPNLPKKEPSLQHIVLLESQKSPVSF